MPKDWRRHEAEIRRLYMIEEKTLEQVRTILDNEHGFTASIRSYRMRFDEWGLHKYRKLSCKQPRPRSLSSVAMKSPSPLASFLEKTTSQLPSTWDRREMSASAGQGLLENFDVAKYDMDFENLPSMLEYWIPDGACLRKALEMLSTNPSWLWMKWTTHRISGIFKSIDLTVAEEEKVPLTKACLVASLRIPDTYPKMQDFWYGWKDASSGKSWDVAQEILYRHCYNPLLLGHCFLECTFTVVAESLLREYMNQIEALLRRTVPLASGKIADIASLRDKYTYILKDCNHARLDDPVWYRYSLQLAECIEAITKENGVLSTVDAITQSIEAIEEAGREFWSEHQEHHPSDQEPVVQIVQDRELDEALEFGPDSRLEDVFDSML